MRRWGFLVLFIAAAAGTGLASDSADFLTNPGPVINVTLTNPAFETTWSGTTAPTGWSQNASFSTSRNTTYRHGGNASVALYKTTSYMRSIQQDKAVDAGRVYNATAWFRDNGNGKARLVLKFFNGTSLLGTLNGAYTTNSSSWQSRTLSAVAPAKANKLRVLVEYVDDPSGSRSTLYADDIAIDSTVVTADLVSGSPGAIYERSPGFYKDGSYWYAIVHTKADVKRVRLVGDFTRINTNSVDLARTPDGKFWWFKAVGTDFYRAPVAGDRYRFILDGDTKVQDPAARWLELTTTGSVLPLYSKVTLTDAFAWTDNAWVRPGWEYYNIYQVHPLRFTSRNSGLTPLQQVTEELDGDGYNDYIKNLGVTAVELLPVNEFYGQYSWGYNPSFFYAVESSYGTPDQLKQLVNTAHGQGIAVVLDLVFNHVACEDNILWTIDQAAYIDGDTRWCGMVNFDDPVALSFFVQNILYLAREYHIDAFRFDATAVIHNPYHDCITVPGSGGGWEFLREIRRKVKALDPGILLVAEELPNDWYITQHGIPAYYGDTNGPFDAQWSDGFHDNFKAVLTGDNNFDRLYSVFCSFGDDWMDGLIYSESHDEVGNTDDRIARRGRDGKGWEMCQVSAAGTILARGIPMVFMGQEAGEIMQFGLDDGKLAQYNPGTGTTWWDDRLDLNAYETDAGRAKIRAWFRKMNDIRRAAMPSFAWGDIQVKAIHGGNKICAFTRDNGKYLIILNFGWQSWPSYGVGVSGNYKEIANTSRPEYNLNPGLYPQTVNSTSYTWHSEFAIPCYGAVVLERQ